MSVIIKYSELSVFVGKYQYASALNKAYIKRTFNRNGAKLKLIVLLFVYYIMNVFIIETMYADILTY